jgi:SNF2-related domain
MAALTLLMKEAGVRLFLKPGRGKTAVALKAFDILKKRDIVDCMLVIAPLRVVATSWPQELGRWEDFDHLTYTLIHGGKTARREAMDKDVDVYLINNEGMISTEFAPTVLNPGAKRKKYGPNPYAVAWFEGRRVMLVVDESTKFKDGQALRSQALKQYLASWRISGSSPTLQIWARIWAALSHTSALSICIQAAPASGTTSAPEQLYWWLRKWPRQP